MKTHHLWVLGILLLSIAALAFLGFFKSQEGFQATSATDVFLSTTARIVADINLTGYTFKNLQIAGTFVDRSVSSPNVVPVLRAVAMEEEGEFVLAILDARVIKMVRIQFTKGSNGALSVVLLSAGSYTYPTNTTPPTILSDSDVKTAWANKTAVSTIISNTGTGYGIKNLKVFVVREVVSGPSGANIIDTVNPDTVNPAATLIRCPPGYRFFNGPSGASMCCKGTINPYTHTCEGVESTKDGICAFSASTPDPRTKYAGTYLTDCRTLATRDAAVKSTVCPTSLPYFAKVDEETEKCCKNPVQLHGETGFTCSDEDHKDTDKYCLVKGTPSINTTDGKQEKLCNEAKMIDTAACPADVLGNKVFQNVTYSLGTREATRYDIADLAGVTIPTCYRLNEVCIPESAIKYAQSRGAFTEYDPSTWEYSCSVWTKRNRGEVVPGEVKGYLTIPTGARTANA